MGVGVSSVSGEVAVAPAYELGEEGPADEDREQHADELVKVHEGLNGEVLATSGGVRIDSAKALAGPFWFYKDYKVVETDLEALDEFDNMDLRDADFKVGEKYHHVDYKSGSQNMDRGRVMVYAGTVYITVGYNCPDESIELVKDRFKLRNINASKIEIERSVEYDRVPADGERDEEEYRPFEPKDEDEYE
jgi:hypothetical protein